MSSRSLDFKLNTSTLTLLILIIGVSFYSIFMINKTQSYAEETGKDWLPSIAKISDLNRDLTLAPRRLIIYTLDWFYDFPKETKTKNAEALIDFIKSFNENLKDYGKFVSDDVEKAQYDKCIENWRILQTQMNEVKTLAENGSGLAAFNLYHEKTLQLVFKLSGSLIEMSDYAYNGGINSTKQGTYLTNLTNISMSITILVSILIGILIFKIIITSTKLIEKSIHNLKKQSVETNKIANNLKTSSKLLANSVSEQASSIHETSAAINEITSMVNRTAENARESTDVAKSASEKSEMGQNTMNKLVKAMETIQESNVQLQNIAGIINQINTKTAVINDIVSKTELLSLNASIESARAGEYGKGFAVVAEEVGNFAKISGKSANEIQELITTSQEQVNKILELTRERVEGGKKVTAEAQDSFIKISEDIIKMSEVIRLSKNILT